MRLTKPYINLNGNSKEDILCELSDIRFAIRDSKKALMKAINYHHPRNAINSKHFADMQKEREDICFKLEEIDLAFSGLIEEIKEEK